MSGLATDGEYLYWSSCFGGVLGRMLPDGRAATASWVTTASKTCPQGIAVGGDHLFYSDLDGYLGRAPLDGGRADMTWMSVGGPDAGDGGDDGAGGLGPYGVYSDGRYLFWNTGNCNACGGHTFIGRSELDGTHANHRWLWARDHGISTTIGFAR